MTFLKVLHEAAKALSDALSAESIAHAFIGGFAVNELGSSRRTEDIDVEIGISNSVELRQAILQATKEDARFVQAGLKIVFRPSDPARPLVPIETLPAGQLGLPRQLHVIRSDNGIPILDPGILVLTKIKRCVNLIGSTRPKSAAKLSSDVSDISYILSWLHDHEKKIDFVRYDTENVDRLYAAVKQLVAYWKEQDDDTNLALIQSVLAEEDQKVL